MVAVGTRGGGKWGVVKRRLCLVLSVFTFTLFISLLFCEWAIFEIAIALCRFPSIQQISNHKSHLPPGEEGRYEELKVMLLADLHLFGNIRSHWADRVKRESQMRTAFHSAIRTLKPDLVFILGDILDEGKWASPDQFQRVSRRYERYFNQYVKSVFDSQVDVYVITGNHDIGFHYDMNHYKVSRFEEKFNSSRAKVISKNGVHFLLLNSVTLKNDSCLLCKETIKQLNEAELILNCLRSQSNNDRFFRANKCDVLLERQGLQAVGKNAELVQPIILQHFPLFRKNETSCFKSDPTSTVFNISKPLVSDWDVLSQQVSNTLMTKFEPRLVVSGHSHYHCEIIHYYKKEKVESVHNVLEVTINSFSWRNNDNPHFMLLTVNNSDYEYSLCHLPRETIQLVLYILIWFCGFMYFVRNYKKCNSNFLDCSLTGPSYSFANAQKCTLEVSSKSDINKIE